MNSGEAKQITSWLNQLLANNKAVVLAVLDVKDKSVIWSSGGTMNVVYLLKHLEMAINKQIQIGQLDIQEGPCSPAKN